MKNISKFSYEIRYVIGYNGEKLSGGQKQILSIARALYKDGKILILDEPSSSLDEDAKKVLQKLLLKLKNKNTIVIVSHETDLFNNCLDNLYNINNGIIEKV